MGGARVVQTHLYLTRIQREYLGRRWIDVPPSVDAQSYVIDPPPTAWDQGSLIDVELRRIAQTTMQANYKYTNVTAETCVGHHGQRNSTSTT